MEYENLNHLIGHSVHSPDFKAILKELHIQEIPVAKIKRYILDIIPDMDIPRIYNEDMRVAFAFMARRGWEDEDLKSSFTDSEYELIVREVAFGKMFKDTVYPFGLVFGDDDKTVTKKINVKPYQKGKQSENGCHYTYYKDNLEILVYFDKDKRLNSFRLCLQDSITKKNIRLRASLKAQKNNITNEHLNELRSLVAVMPTKAWIERISADSDESETPLFTAKTISAAETELNKFLLSLESAVNNNKASQVQRAIKQTVEAFNKMNNNDDHFIDTLEREELVEFMTKAVRLTGFKVEEGADITEEWRKW